MKRRFLLLTLCLAILLLFVPAFAWAEDDPAEKPDGASVTVIVPGETIRGEELDLPDNSTLFSQYVDKQLKPAPRRRLMKSAGAGNGLTGVNGAIYAQLSPLLPQVADGNVSSTVFEVSALDIGLDPISWTAAELGLETIFEGEDISQAALDAVSIKLAEQIDLNLLLSALLADNPYNLYWYDKTMNTGYSFNVTTEGEMLTVGELYFFFPVLADYAAEGEEFTVDASVAETVQTVKTNAQAIVNKYADKSDYEKLDGYRREICDLVSYNFDALDELNAGTAVNGNPWQLLWVFDGDPTTNVVCEGYAKAFQYLCDLTTNWKSDQIRCITVTGTMSGGTGAGAHMWNIVRMEDGNNYLVDVTNCDSGSVGAPRGLFLAGSQDSAALGVTYTYNAQECAVYDNSALLLHETAYSTATATCGDALYWSFDESTGTLTITGSGAMYDYGWWGNPYQSQSLDSPIWSGDTVKHVILENGVTSIGQAAFYGCSGLQSISIPESVTSIGDAAFSNCSSLTSIVIPDGVTSIGKKLFSGCSSLTSIAIPESMDCIGYAAMENCSSLTSFVIPDGVTSIEKGTFYGCSNLTSVVVPESVIHFGEQAFWECRSLTSITIPEGETTLSNSVFYRCSGLTSIVIPDSVTSIELRAFSGCSSLSSITIPTNVTSIGIEAFAGCTSLSSIVIPNGVTSIPNSAFMSCRSLASVVLPETLTSIGEFAFHSCENLTSLYLPDAVESIGRCAFTCCESLETIHLPASLTCINEQTFQALAITSVVIPKGVTSIGKNAFINCESLQSVTIPDSVTSIGDSAFKNCDLLSLTIPNSVTSIGDEAFSSNVNLTSVVLSDGVTSIGDDAFAKWNEILEVECGSYAQTWAKENGYTNLIEDPTLEYGYISSNHKNTGVLPAIDPNCTESGFAEGSYCVDCGDVIHRQRVDALGHDWSEPIYTLSEDKSLITAYHCCQRESCHEEESETIAVYSYIPGSATCTENGQSTYTCYPFDTEGFELQSLILDDIPALGHDLVHHDAREATCTENGWEAYDACSRCDYTTYVEIPALDHTPGEPVLENLVPATSEAEGSYDEVVYCTICGEELSREHRTIDRLAETFTGVVTYRSGRNVYLQQGATGVSVRLDSSNDAELMEQAELGKVVTVTGARMSYVQGEYTIPQLGDAMIESVADEGATATTVSAALDQLGDPLMAMKVSVRGTKAELAALQLSLESYADEHLFTVTGVLSANGQGMTLLGADVQAEHTPGEAVQENLVEATCTDEGSYDEVIYCTVCHEELSRETKTIDALGHDLVHHEAQEATCTEIGWEAYDTCSRCDYTTYVEIPALGHDLVHHEAQVATCTELGWEAYDACSRCDYTTYVEIPALGHDLVHHEAQEATCTEIGWAVYDACTRCDYTTYAEIPALGHTPGETVRENEVAATTAAEGGYDEVVYCAVCGEELSREHKTIDKLPAIVTGWQKVDGKWYYYDTNGVMVTGWQTVSGKKYYFDANGIMKTGWLKLDGKWYYLNSSGAMLTGWQTISGKKYYLGTDGIMKTGWVKVDNKWYYLNSSGAMLTGWQTISGKKYYLGTDGVMKTGWVKVDNKWYYLNTSGAMLTGWQTISGKKYYLGTDGIMKTDWQKIDAKWYYFNTSGAMLTGWQTISGKKYYLGTDGVMVTGFQKISGKLYYFDNSGVLFTTAGWKKIGTKWYYFESSGVAQTGWKQISGKWYYLGSDGSMATGWKTLNKKTYYLGTDGAMVTKWKKIDNKWYYFEDSGAMLQSTTKTIGNKAYTFDDKGVCTNP